MNNIEKQIEEIQSKVDESSPSAFKKITFATLFCFLIVLIGAYASYLLGARYFILEQSLINSNVIDSILFFINIFFWFSIALNVYDKRIILLICIYLPIYIFFEFLPIKETLITSTVVPIIFIILVSIINKTFISSLVRNFLFCAISICYQYISCTVKLNYVKLSYNSTSSYQLFMFSIDMILFFLILYVIGCGKNEKIQYWKHLVDSQDFNDSSCDDEDRQAIEEFSRLNNWQKFKTIMLLSIFQVSQIMIIVIISIIGNSLIELIFILAAYLIYSKIITRRYHSRSLLICTALSTLIFFSASKITIPVKISMFVPIILGLIITYSLYILAVHVEEYEYLKNKKLNDFDIYDCTEEELYDLCDHLGLSKRNTMYAKFIFFDKLSAKDIAIKLNVIEQTVYNKKYKLLKILNIRN